MADAYVYLLGLYLGDGNISRYPRHVWRLRITLDTRYPEIIERCAAAVYAVRWRQPGRTHRAGCDEVYSDWKHWPCLFPQHGPGVKHQRVIRLASWQAELVASYPAALLAGLIHSDGCRVQNRVKGYSYPRYLFSNESRDILELFQLVCEMLGVDCRPTRRNCISVARKRSVERLDELVGPKA